MIFSKKNWKVVLVAKVVNKKLLEELQQSILHRKEIRPIYEINEGSIREIKISARTEHGAIKEALINARMYSAIYLGSVVFKLESIERIKN